MTSTLPNFLILGAQKCGTTWLHEKLSKHPEFYMSKTKEIHFFNANAQYKKGIEFYQTFFEDAYGKRFIGESTPNYFWTNNQPIKWLGEGIQPQFMIGIPERIKSDLGEKTKFILIVRNPVDRAISAFYHHLKFEGRIDLNKPFKEIIKMYGIVHMGFYASHLEHYLKSFPIAQFLILTYEELFANPKEETAKVLRFLGADQGVELESLEEKIHIGKAKNEIDGEYYFKKSKFENPIKVISKKQIEALKFIFKEPNNQLREMLGRDIKHWD